MQALFRGGFVVFCLTAACREQPAPPSSSPAPAETESPNARILPEPLPESELGGLEEPEEGPLGPAPTERTLLALRKPVPLVGPLPAEPFSPGIVSGLVLTGAFGWAPTRGLVSPDGETWPTWPTLRVELVPAFASQPGRIRLVLSSHVWGLPLGTELRGRSDMDGLIVVWPDGRSYRAVAQGALRALLEERRVDRMPLVPLELSELGPGRRLGRVTRKLRANGPSGALRLDLAAVPESGLESSLLCDFFFGLVRAQTPVGVCADGELPLFVEVEAGAEGSVQFSVGEMRVQTDLRREAFVIPPALAIFKPGELPPSGSDLWPREFLEGLLPRTADGAQVHFKNHHDVPLFLLLDGVPVSRIDPGTQVVWDLGAAEHRHAARDFLGQVLEAGGTVKAPAVVNYGKAIPLEETL